MSEVDPDVPPASDPEDRQSAEAARWLAGETRLFVKDGTVLPEVDLYDGSMEGALERKEFAVWREPKRFVWIVGATGGLVGVLAGWIRDWFELGSGGFAALFGTMGLAAFALWRKLLGTYERFHGFVESSRSRAEEKRFWAARIVMSVAVVAGVSALLAFPSEWEWLGLSTIVGGGLVFWWLVRTNIRCVPLRDEPGWIEVKGVSAKALTVLERIRQEEKEALLDSGMRNE